MNHHPLPGSSELCCTPCAPRHFPDIKCQSEEPEVVELSLCLTQRAQEHHSTCTALSSKAPTSSEHHRHPGRFAPLCFHRQAGAKSDFKGFVLILFDVAKASKDEKAAFPCWAPAPSPCTHLAGGCSHQDLRKLTTAAHGSGCQLVQLWQQQIQRCVQLPILSPSSGSRLCPLSPPLPPAQQPSCPVPPWYSWTRAPLLLPRPCSCPPQH